MFDAFRFLIRPRFAAKGALVISCALLVQGCADLMPHTKMPKAAEPSVVTTPKPAVKTPTVKPPVKSASLTRSVMPMSDSIEMQVSVSFLERIALPAGSKLQVSVVGPASSKPIVVNTLTSAGPPYMVTLRLPAGMTYPATLSATLNATSGHAFSGQSTLTQRPTGTTDLRISPSN